MKGLRVTFSTFLRICEKCDFEQLSYVFAIFFDFRRVGFRLEKVYFSDVFSKAILRRAFSIFRRILIQIGEQMGPKIDEKINENLS